MTKFFLAAAVIGLCAGTVSCSRESKADPAAEAPPQQNVIVVGNPNVITVANPESFKLATATLVEEAPELSVTGVVNADVDYSVPVVSLASGRVVGIYAKLGDEVKKGQLLLKVVSNDVSNAYQNYGQAQADAALAEKQYERSKLLYDHGAISLNDLQVAEDGFQKAKVAAESARQQFTILGGDLNNPTAVISIYAPASGTIVEQNVVQSASVHTPDNQPNLFTIANLSTVWVLCDVYENDLPGVHLGDRADIHLDAYPDEVLTGTVSNIGTILDPTLRTAKVRIVLRNNGHMKAGMFVKATLYGLHGVPYSSVPANAVLNLHDREWVFVPHGGREFERMEVHGARLAGDQMRIRDGLKPGQRVAADALSLESETQQ